MYVVIQLPNTVAETLGTGGTVKFRSPCPVIVQLVGVGNVATLNGTDTFTAPAVGDYLFENTCDCNGFYQVTSTGDMTDGCCVTPITNATGELIGITVAGVEYLNPTPVTYTWSETNPNDGDGVIEYTGVPSDGSANSVITLAEPTVDTNTIPTGSTINNGIVTSTFTDADGNPLPDQTLDLNALISSDHPAFIGTGSTTAVYDAVANTWTIDSSGGTDTDTYMTLTVAADGAQTWQKVDINGDPVGASQVIPATTDTDISAVRADLTETELTVGVTENGTELTGTIGLHALTCDTRPPANLLVSAREIWDFIKPTRSVIYKNVTEPLPAGFVNYEYFEWIVPECGQYLITGYIMWDWSESNVPTAGSDLSVEIETSGLSPSAIYNRSIQSTSRSSNGAKAASCNFQIQINASAAGGVVKFYTKKLSGTTLDVIRLAGVVTKTNPIGV